MKLKRMRISFEALVYIFKEGSVTEVLADGLPKDAHAIAVYPDDRGQTATCWVVLTSESFEDLQEGAIIPEVSAITFHKANLAEKDNRIRELEDELENEREKVSDRDDRIQELSDKIPGGVT